MQTAPTPTPSHVTCDACTKSFPVEANTYTKERQDEPGTVDHGLRCPHCKTEHHGYSTTTEVRTAQKRLQAANALVHNAASGGGSLRTARRQQGRAERALKEAFVKVNPQYEGR